MSLYRKVTNNCSDNSGKKRDEEEEIDMSQYG